MGLWITIDPYFDPIAAFETEAEAKASIGPDSGGWPSYYEDATWENWVHVAFMPVKPWEVEPGEPWPPVGTFSHPVEWPEPAPTPAGAADIESGPVHA